ncbi:MAG: hypothetical protein JRN68_10500 [Nitrososphaerota archaeon]|jgi:predicted homoserine dehydrogenase-like protein|nr:hypothetical protein [Nitrososphaerota archaeon]
MSTIVRAKNTTPLADEIEQLFKELKQIPTDLMERGRFVPMNMDDDPDIMTSYNQIKELNNALDASFEDPLRAFAAANNVFNAYGSLFQNFTAALHSVKGALGLLTSRVVTKLQGMIVRFSTLVHKLVSNAISMIKHFSKELGISNFSVSLNSSPPGVSVSFTYKASK